MIWLVLYFSIGFALAIMVYLYSCYDYKVNCRNWSWSWDRYVTANGTYNMVCIVIIGYPLILFILLLAGLRWCFYYTTECVREYIFKR